MKNLNYFLNEGKNDKKIKAIKDEIKALKDENEEGFETEIKELEFELSLLEENSVSKPKKAKLGLNNSASL